MLGTLNPERHEWTVKGELVAESNLLSPTSATLQTSVPLVVLHPGAASTALRSRQLGARRPALPGQVVSGG
jgi:hypothetical protein